MPINPSVPGVHHICLRSTDFDVTKQFYTDIIGWPLVVNTPDLIIFSTGSVFIAFKQAEPRNEQYFTFSPFEVGLDHIALTCESEEELGRYAKGLADAKVDNTGVKLDTALNKMYVAFKDPDRIQWEFYMS